MSDRYGDLGEPVVRDKRRIDPETGELRQPQVDVTDLQPEGTVPAGTFPPSGSEAVDTVDTVDVTDGAGLAAQLAERTADLQRLQAEYANYRRRVDRDRVATQEMALAGVLANLLPVLDDIGRARQHGELEGGFKSVGEALEAMTSKLGLIQFGAPGDPFDPTLHEALTHTHSAEVTESTAVSIYQPGYRLGERVLRPARVGVADPAEATGDEADEADQAAVAEDSAE